MRSPQPLGAGPDIIAKVGKVTPVLTLKEEGGGKWRQIYKSSETMESVFTPGVEFEETIGGHNVKVSLADVRFGLNDFIPTFI